MKTRSVVNISSNSEVLILEQASMGRATGKIMPGEQVSLWPSARAKKNCKHKFTMELGDHMVIGTKKKIEKISLSTHPNLVHGCLLGMAICCTSSPASHSSPADDFWEDEEFDAELSQFRGLVLDLAYRPINVVCWRRALCLDILEKADVLEYYDQTVNSPQKEFLIPAVLRITDYVHTPKVKRLRMSLSRKNVFLRDKYKCQYCNAKDNLTLDHVIPVSRGGGWTWDNLVTACSRCNLKKGDKTLAEAKMELIRPPKEPKEIDGRGFPSSYAAYRTLTGSTRLPDQWLDYISQMPWHI